LPCCPFRTHGKDHEDDYLGAGVVEDIIVALQSIRGLLVISRTSTLAYREDPTQIGKVGQELGVRYVLGGSVRRADQRLRIAAELIDVEKNSVIWADRYEGDLAELFEFQNRIAVRIVWSIAPRVREAEIKRALRKRPDNMNAYDLVMQAINLMYRMNLQDFTRAGELLRRAISADEKYATAYAYAALWHIHNVAQGWANEEGLDSAEAARLAARRRDRSGGWVRACDLRTHEVVAVPGLCCGADYFRASRPHLPAMLWHGPSAVACTLTSETASVRLLVPNRGSDFHLSMFNLDSISDS
jgi:adenylate cyclase